DNQTTFGPGLTIHRADAATPSRLLISIGSGSLTNQATIRADAADEIDVTSLSGATFTNAVGGVLAAAGGAAVWLTTAWSNAGQVGVNDSTVSLGGSFTTAGIGTINRTGGTIYLIGLLDNTGHTLALDATTGSWNLAIGGTLRGGSLVTSGGAALVGGGSSVGGTLDGVTLGGTVGGVPTSATVQGNRGGITVTGGLTFTNGSLVDLGTQMVLSGDQTVGGNGEIRFRSGAEIHNL